MELMNDPASASGDMLNDLSDAHLKLCLSRAEARFQKTSSVLGQQHSSLPKLDTSGLTKYHPCGEGSTEKVASTAKEIDASTFENANTDKKRKETAGPKWFNLPKTNLTPEMKRDLQLLRMRNVLDAKRHYKKDSRKPEVPPFSQVGTIQEGPTEFFSSRINNRDRKQTLANQVMAIEHSTGRFKSKYLDRQVKKKSGKKAHVKAVKAKRSRNPFV